MKKTPQEKLITKINHLKDDSSIEILSDRVKIRNKIFFRYNDEIIEYTKKRYYPTKKEDIVDDDYITKILLDDKTINILGTNIINPPKGVDIIITAFRALISKQIDTILIGDTNAFEGNTIQISYDLYNEIIKIDKSERDEKKIRFSNRIIPFINDRLGMQLEKLDSEIDYSLLLNEFLTSGEFTEDDILALSAKISSGNLNRIVIEKQITKQAEWLLTNIQNIIDTLPLTTEIAKKLGKKYFGFSKIEISGPEHLLEKILTEFGKTVIFGAPYLINTNKYIVNKSKIQLSRSQFDLILVNHLADIQVVELKRSDKILLEFDYSRNKFYPSSDLSIAISQAERYISAVLHENDEEYLINDMRIRDYLNTLVGGDIQIDICRPSALIVIGVIQNLAKDYDSLSVTKKNKYTKEEYDKNMFQAYKEIKGAFKNIQITTYSELVETARLRLNAVD